MLAKLQVHYKVKGRSSRLCHENDYAGLNNNQIQHAVYSSTGVLVMCFRICSTLSALARWLIATSVMFSGLGGAAFAEDDVEVQMATLRSTIEVLEQGGDTWHPQIAETILSLAGHMQAIDEHEEALALLERAVHLSRINNGLFSVQQLPGLRMQVDSHMALDQWSEADGLQQYAFYVHTRSFGDHDLALLPAIEAYAAWSLQTFAQRRGDYPAARLIDAYQLYSVAISILDKHPEAADRQRREEYLQQLVYVSWLMSRTGVQTRPEASMNEARKVDDGWADRMTEGRYRVRNNPFLQGQAALQEIIDMRAAEVAAAAPGSDARSQALRQQAEAILDLGDWNLLFERRQGSNAVYQQAWNLLAQEDDALRSALFERIVVLPRFDPMVPLRPARRRAADDSGTATALADAGDGDASSPQTPARGTRSPYVVMSFDLNQFGRARNVEVLESWPADDTQMERRLQTALRESRMRPRIGERGALASEGLTYRFPYEIERRTTVAQ
jgi:hypothetical protein